MDITDSPSTVAEIRAGTSEATNQTILEDALAESYKKGIGSQALGNSYDRQQDSQTNTQPTPPNTQSNTDGQAKQLSEQAKTMQANPLTNPEPDSQTSQAQADIDADNKRTDWKAEDIQIPEYLSEFKDQLFNKDQLSRFSEIAGKTGITKEAAQALVEWQAETILSYKEQAIKNCEATLKREWGNNYDQNWTAVRQLVANIDKNFGSTEFSSTLGNYGVSMEPVFLKFLLSVANDRREDSIGLSYGSAPRPKIEDNARVGLENALMEMRAKQFGK